MTPLLVAARTGNYILVELLLSNNATIDQGDDVRRCMFPRYIQYCDGHTVYTTCSMHYDDHCYL